MYSNVKNSHLMVVQTVATYIHVPHRRSTLIHGTRVNRNKPRIDIAELNSSVSRAFVRSTRKLGFDSQFWSILFCLNNTCVYAVEQLKPLKNKETNYCGI